MAIRVELYRDEHVLAVKDFNGRLAGGDVHAGFWLPERVLETPEAVANGDGPVFKEQYVAVDEDGCVRGGFLMQHQRFWVSRRRGEGHVRLIGNLQMPIAEGVIDHRHAGVGVTLVRHALRMHPESFCLGMRGRDLPLPRLLAAMGWTLREIPFLFRMEHPARVLRNLGPLAAASGWRRLMRLAAASGAAWAGARLVQTRFSRPEPVPAEVCSGFGAWADEIWDVARHELALSAVRSSEMLNALHPPASRSVCLRMTGHGRPIGWAMLRDTQMHGHRYFGDLRVGTIVDVLARPGTSAGVVAAATSFLQQRDVDLIVSNQSHHEYVGAFRRYGFVLGRSNFILAVSPALAALLEPEPLAPAREHSSRLHITRGDGDGPLDL